MHELGYLILLITMFPYVYPRLSSEKYDYYPIIIICLYAVIFLVAVMAGIIGLLSQLYEKEDEIPINQEPELDMALAATNKDVMERWLEGKEHAKLNDQPTDEEQSEEADGEGESEVDQEEQEEEPETEKEEESKTVKTISEESDESDTEEESEETSSEEETSKEGNADDYANLKNIPQSDVNLDGLAFGTGMSGVREKKIQEYRNFEKSGKY